MRSNPRWIVVLGVIAGTCLNGAGTKAASQSQPDEATAMMSGYDAEQRAAAAARSKDTAWKPTCKEIALLQISDSRNPSALKNFCLDKEGNILACFAGAAKSSDPKNAAGIRVYSPKGELLKTLPLEIAPEAICVAKDGHIFTAGEGLLLKLDATARVENIQVLRDIPPLTIAEQTAVQTWTFATATRDGNPASFGERCGPCVPLARACASCLTSQRTKSR